MIKDTNEQQPDEKVQGARSEKVSSRSIEPRGTGAQICSPTWKPSKPIVRGFMEASQVSIIDY